MSYEEFTPRWRGEHAALVREKAQAMGFLKYVQSHKKPSAEIAAFAESRGWKTPPDGLAEVWWESEESMQAAMGSPEGQEASQILAEDEKQFIDMKMISAFLAEEHSIFDFT